MGGWPVASWHSLWRENGRPLTRSYRLTLLAPEELFENSPILQGFGNSLMFGFASVV
jgi:hypothetical protein